MTGIRDDPNKVSDVVNEIGELELEGNADEFDDGDEFELVDDEELEYLAETEYCTCDDDNDLLNLTGNNDAEEDECVVETRDSDNAAHSDPVHEYPAYADRANESETRAGDDETTEDRCIPLSAKEEAVSVCIKDWDNANNNSAPSGNDSSQSEESDGSEILGERGRESEEPPSEEAPSEDAPSEDAPSEDAPHSSPDVDDNEMIENDQSTEMKAAVDGKNNINTSAEEDDDGGDDDDDDEDEEEKDIVDPWQVMMEKCGQTQCRKQRQLLEDCNERLENDDLLFVGETCSEELFNFIQCKADCAQKLNFMKKLI